MGDRTVIPKAAKVRVGADHEGRPTYYLRLSIDPRFENLMPTSNIEPAGTRRNMVLENIRVHSLRRPKAGGKTSFDQPIQLPHLYTHRCSIEGFGHALWYGTRLNFAGAHPVNVCRP